MNSAMTKPYNLPRRYEGRWDVPYVIKGRKLSDMEPLAVEITSRLAEGESLRAICRSKGMPSIGTILAWIAADPAMAKRYALAREAQSETFAQELTDLADSAQGLDSAGVNAARLRVDTRKWIAARILPKQYGDNVQVEHSGALSVATVSKLLRVEPVTFDDVEDAELVAISDRPIANSDELSAVGMELAGVSTNGGDETPTGGGAYPGKGTPIPVTTPVSSAAQNSKIPSEIPHTSDDIPTALSDLL